MWLSLPCCVAGPCPGIRMASPSLPVLTRFETHRPVEGPCSILARWPPWSPRPGAFYLSVLSPLVLVPRDYSGYLCTLPIFPALHCAHLDPLGISQSEGQGSFCAWQTQSQGLMECRYGLCPVHPDTQMTHVLWIL